MTRHYCEWEGDSMHLALVCVVGRLRLINTVRCWRSRRSAAWRARHGGDSVNGPIAAELMDGDKT